MYTETKATLLLCLFSLLLSTTSQAAVVHDEHGKPVDLTPPVPPVIVDDLIPSGRGWGQPPDVGAAAGKSRPVKASSNGINYHNGPLITDPAHIYYIWYGDWAANTAPSILTNLADSIGGTSYYGINTTYYDTNKSSVINSALYMGAATDSYSRGTALSDANIQDIVADQISNGMPADPNAVYFVLTSADVNETSGFCTQYCGWHTHGTIAGVDIKYSFIGNPDRCPSACSVQTTTSPNGNPGADGMASIIAHELVETVTDPDLNAWYDTRGRENADKCAWTFGATYTVGNGSKANMNLGSKDYLIQQNWVNANGGYCALSYP
jgi:hypothetical protein